MKNLTATIIPALVAVLLAGCASQPPRKFEHRAVPPPAKDTGLQQAAPESETAPETEPIAAPEATPVTAPQTSPTLLPAISIEQREDTLFDFESRVQAVRWRASNTSKSPQHQHDPRFASKGNGCLAFQFDTGPRYPGIALSAPARRPFDWSQASYLRFDLHNPEDKPFRLSLRIDSLDDAGNEIRSTREFSVRPGKNQLEFNLATYGGRHTILHTERVTRLILFAIEPEETLQLYLDELRLAHQPVVHAPVDNAFLFDFEPSGASTMSGFTAVEPEAKLTQGATFGFTQPPAKAGTADYHIDSLADDYIYAPSGEYAEFSVRIPDGKYSVAAFVRGFDILDLPTREWAILANGKIAAKHGVSASSFYSITGYYRGFGIDYTHDTDVWQAFVKDHVPLYQFEADTTGGLLRISFKSCAVYGVLIWPAEHDEWGRALIQQIQQMRREQFYTYNWSPAHAPAGEPSEQPAAFFTPVSYSDTIDTEYVPEQIGAAHLAVSAAPGEYEPAAIAIRPETTLENLSAHLSDLAADDGATIPADAVEVLIARPYYHLARGFHRLVPSVLGPVSGQTLRAGVTRKILLDIKVPQDAQPGDYTGTISLTADNLAEPLVAQLTLTVRPIRLAGVDDLPVSFAAYYGDPYTFKHHYLRFYSGREAFDKAIGEECKNMREHGFNSLTLRIPRVTGMRDGVLQLDFEAAERIIKIMREHGLNKHPVPIWMIGYANYLIEQGYTEFSPEFNTILSSTLARIVQWAEKNEQPITFWAVDEPREQELLSWHRNRADTLRYLQLLRQVPGAKSYVTVTSDTNRGVDYTAIARESDIIALHAMPDSRKSRAAARQLYIYNAGRTRLSWGFYTWKTGARGRHEWAYQWLNMPYNPLDPASQWAVAYPSPHGLLSTVDQKRIREGIDDYRYIHTLETLVEQAKAAGRDATSAATLLDEIRQAVPESLEYGKTYDIERLLDTWRRRIAEEIRALQQGAEPDED